jgi:hypothetical protein
MSSYKNPAIIPPFQSRVALTETSKIDRIQQSPWRPATVPRRLARHAYASKRGLRMDIRHQYYVPLHKNLLIIYIIRMKSRLAVPSIVKLLSNVLKSLIRQSSGFGGKRKIEA